MTFGEFCKLPIPPETELIKRISDDLAYGPVREAQTIAVCPGDLRIVFYSTQDLRARGRIPEQVLLVT